MEQDGPLDREGEAKPHGQNREAENIDGEATHRKLHGVDWAGIEREYVHGDKSLNRISDIYGPSSTTISKYAKAGGWVRLVGTKRLKGGRPPRQPGMARTKPPPAKIRWRQQFVRRLFMLLDDRLIALEARMADANANFSELSAGEIEREARAVSTIAGCYKKIVELEEAARKAGKSSEMSAVRSEEDADRLRRELAERLERLAPSRTE